MKIFQIVCIIIVGCSLLFNLSNFFIREIKIKKKSQHKLKLRNIKVWDYLSVFLGPVFIILGIYYYSLQSNLHSQYPYWIILGVSIIVSGLLNIGDYIIIDSRGIKEFHFIRWDALSDMSKNQYKPTEINFEGKKQILNVDFYSVEKIDEFKSLLKNIRPDILERYKDKI